MSGHTPGLSRLAILEASLQKKTMEFDKRLNEHFGSVKSANGQPLNDKRDGQKTLASWDRQNQRLRALS